MRRLSDAPADYFIICEGDSTTQVKAISDRIHQRVKMETGMAPNHVEGERQALWICVDYFNILVHVFHRETRAFYELEELWSDAQLTEFANL